MGGGGGVLASVLEGNVFEGVLVGYRVEEQSRVISGEGGVVTEQIQKTDRKLSTRRHRQYARGSYPQHPHPPQYP